MYQELLSGLINQVGSLGIKFGLFTLGSAVFFKKVGFASWPSLILGSIAGTTLSSIVFVLVRG